MTIYLLCCDLRDTTFDYEHLFDDLRAMGGRQAQPTAWLVESDQTVAALSDHLLRLMSGGDGLLIVEVGQATKWAATRLKEGAGEWLKAHRP